MNDAPVPSVEAEWPRGRAYPTLLAAVVVGAIAFGRVAGACECVVMPANVAELYGRSSHIFIGEVISLRDAEGERPPKVATVRVVDAIKGALSGTIQVEDGLPGLCEFAVFTVGGLGRYLIFASGEGDYLRVDNPCPNTSRVEWFDHATLTALRRFAKRRNREK